MFAIRFGEATLAFGDVRGDRQFGSVALVGKVAVTALELFGSHANSVSEIDRLLVNEELLEWERHTAAPGEQRRAEERSAEQRRAVLRTKKKVEQ